MRFLSRWPVTLMFAVVTILLSLAGYYGQMPRDHWLSPLDWLVATIALFKMSWTWKEAWGDVPGTLEVARLTGASFTISALAKVWMKFFGDQMRRLKLSWISGHVVVCGLGRKGLQIAREFRRRGMVVVVLDRDPVEDDARLCRREGILLEAGDATKDGALEAVRVETAKYLFAVCRDDRTNLEVTMGTLARFRERGRGELTCYTHLVDLPLRVLLQRHELLQKRPPGFHLKFFNVFENTARTLLARHPLEGGASEPVHLVIVGLTRLGEAIATQAARVGHYANATALRLTLVDEQAATRGEQFLMRQPGVAQVCPLALEQLRLAEPRFNRLEFLDAGTPEKVTIVFCLEQDEANVQLALSFAERARPGLTLVATIAERHGLARLLAASAEELERENVKVIDAFEAVADWDILNTEANDALARTIAEYYQKKHGGPSWADLSEDLRNSNRAAADHIDVKLRAVGCERGPLAGAASFAFSPEEVELLARIEHRRWWADRVLNGWTLGGTIDRAHKLHTDLKPFDELTADSQEKDREQVRALPDILATRGEAIRRR